jgi:hypothetical protein
MICAATGEEILSALENTDAALVMAAADATGRPIGAKLTEDWGICIAVRSQRLLSHGTCMGANDHGRTHHETSAGRTTCVIHPEAGDWAISPLPLKDSDHLRFEVRLSDDTLLHDLKRLGFELRLLSQLTRVDAWAVTELIPVGNTHRLRQHPGIVDICVYEVELPEVELPEIAEPSD